MIILNEENNDLKGKMFPIFDGLRKHLKKTLSDYEERNGDKNNDGYDRLVWICSQDSISTEEMKRIKNFFDNFMGTEECDDFILNGGKEMKDWVNRMLKVATDTVKNEKEAKQLMGLDDKKKKEIKDVPKPDKNGVVKIQTKNLSNSISKNNVVKENKTIILTRHQINLLKEAISVSEGFSLEKLTELCLQSVSDSYKGNGYGMGNAVQYCDRCFGDCDGDGIGRVVYFLDDEKVLKLEKYTTCQQNSDELSYTMQLEKQGITIIPHIYDYCKDGYKPYWLISERCVPCRIMDFQHILGIPFKTRDKKQIDTPVNDRFTYQYGNHEEYQYSKNEVYLINDMVCVEGFIFYSRLKHEGNRKLDDYVPKSQQHAYETLIQTNDWFAQLDKITEITGSDDLHYENFGMVKRDGKPIIVVLDLGL
jgi:hypothetical protein